MNKPEKDIFSEYRVESERLAKEKYERFLQECGVEAVINLIYRNLKFIPLEIVEFKEGGYHVVRYLGFRVPTKVLDDNDKKYDLVYYFDDIQNKFFKFCGPDPDNNFIPIVEEIEIFEEGMQNAIVAILNNRIKENHDFSNIIKKSLLV